MLRGSIFGLVAQYLQYMAVGKIINRNPIWVINSIGIETLK